MRRAILSALLAACVLALALPAAAQVVTNPTTVVFDHVDHVTATAYFGGYFALPVLANNTCDVAASPAASPAMTDSLGKPATTTGVGLTAPLSARPIGCYVYKVRALDASGLFSDWSTSSDPFVKRPATPGKPVIR